MSDRLSVKAIVVGALVDVLASMVGGFIAAVAAAVIVGLQADPGADQVGAISTAFAESVPLALIGIAAGSIGSIATGWVAARIAGARHVLNLPSPRPCCSRGPSGAPSSPCRRCRAGS